MNRLHADLAQAWRDLAAEAAKQRPPDYPPKTPSHPGGFPLDRFQERAAAHLAGAIRVLAPAGSGKTRTLTARIARLVAAGIPPEKILALAFNTKAAEEMAERLAGSRAATVQTRTFHSLGYEIVREASGERYAPENEQEVREMAEGMVRRYIPLPEHPGEARRLAARALAVLTRARSDLIPYREMQVTHLGTAWPLAPAFDELLDRQRARGLLTFSDMIYFALSSLVEDADLRRRWQDRFEFILVDEFQDLNAAQMLLVRILALPQNNLFVVGDDDQLIYAWRGAEERHILAFDEMYPGAESVVLATNYRSAVRIVRHGRWLIEHNPVRVPKDIRPAAAAAPGEFEIALRGSPEAQARAAVEWVLSTRRAGGLDWGDFGLLVRVNKDAEKLEAALEAAGIPYQAAGPDDPEPGQEAAETDDGAVALMTIHKSKGKEFPYVVYFNLSRGGGAALEETDERRVAYVGVTRAGRGLLVTADRARPARFLEELALNPEFDDFAEPYLQRELTAALRRRLLGQGDWRSWLATFFTGPLAVDRSDLGGAGFDEQIDLLAGELHFRAVLGIEKKP